MANSTALNHEIITLQSDIINKLGELENEKSVNQKKKDIINIGENLLPTLLEKRLERDVPKISFEKKKELITDVQDFILKGTAKNYFTENNIIVVLKQLTQGLANFRELPMGNIYGEWSGYRGGGTLALDFNKSPEFMKHIVFHELAHCITPDLGPISQAVVQTDRKTEKGFKIWARKSGYEFGWNESEVTFLKECIAESMACELDEMYKPERAVVGSKKSGITSDWVTPYNRTYQKLGDEFLQTLSFINTKENNTDRKRFKALTKMAIMPNNRVAKKIDEEYDKKNKENGSRDLEKISMGLSKLLNRTSATQEEVTSIRSMIEPYKEKVVEKQTTDEEDEKIEQILRLYDKLSPESQVQLYSELFGFDEKEEKIFSDFVKLSPESRKEILEKL